MALTIKCLGAGSIPTTEAALFSAPAGAAVVIQSIRVTNPTNVGKTVTLKLKQGANTRNITAYLTAVAAYSTLLISETLTLSPAGEILAAGSSGLEYVASGVERSV